MTARHASEGTALPQRIADQFERHALDLRFPRLADAALAAAYRILADAEIADGLRARAVLAAIDTMHQPRTWRGGSVTVCDTCDDEYPCETRRLIDGATQTPARLDPDPAGPSGLCPGTGAAQGEANTRARPGFQPHHPEWQGNRCANCNTPLATAGPYCNVQKASIR